MRECNRLSGAVLLVSLGTLGLTGCQNFLATPGSTQIRIIDASAGTPMLDVYQGQAALTYNVNFGNVTSYVAASSGSSEFTANASGGHQALASIHETLAPGQYTLLLGNTEASFQPLLLKDQNTPAPAGQSALRFIDQVTASHAFDIYLVPPGTSVSAVTPTLTNQTLNGISGYLNIASGSYRIVLYPTGVTPSAAIPATYSGTTVTYASGSVRTIVLLDGKAPLHPGVQLISAMDVEPAARAN